MFLELGYVAHYQPWVEKVCLRQGRTLSVADFSSLAKDIPVMTSLSSCCRRRRHLDQARASP